MIKNRSHKNRHSILWTFSDQDFEGFDITFKISVAEFSMVESFQRYRQFLTRQKSSFWRIQHFSFWQKIEFLTCISYLHYRPLNSRDFACLMRKFLEEFLNNRAENLYTYSLKGLESPNSKIFQKFLRNFPFEKIVFLPKISLFKFFFWILIKNINSNLYDIKESKYEFSPWKFSKIFRGRRKF